MMLLDDVLERAAILEFDAGFDRVYSEQIAFLEVMKNPMPFPFNSILFVSSDDSEESIAEAQKYIANNGFSGDDVRLVKKSGMTFVLSKRVID